jgi:hypothetical protein
MEGGLEGGVDKGREGVEYGWRGSAGRREAA